MTPFEQAEILKSDARKLIQSGIWSCVVTHLHLVPEVNVDKAVKAMCIYMVDKIIDEMENEVDGNDAEDRSVFYYQVKNIL
jgi:hypothetical protein